MLCFVHNSLLVQLHWCILFYVEQTNKVLSKYHKGKLKIDGIENRLSRPFGLQSGLARLDRRRNRMRCSVYRMSSIHYPSCPQASFWVQDNLNYLYI